MDFHLKRKGMIMRTPKFFAVFLTFVLIAVLLDSFGVARGQSSGKSSLPVLCENEGSENQLKEQLNYSKLEGLLKVKNWKDADKETLILILKALGKSEDELPSKESIINLPCTVLKNIDKLWMKYSKNRFGFTAQLSLNKECMTKYADFYPSEYRCFAEKNGWLKKEKWIKYSDVYFDLSAPVGHLPATTLLLLDKISLQCPKEEELSSKSTQNAESIQKIMLEMFGEQVTEKQAEIAKKKYLEILGITETQAKCMEIQTMLVYGGPLSLIYYNQCQIELQGKTDREAAARLYNYANELRDNGELKKSTIYFCKATIAAPNDAWIYNNLGVVLGMQERFEESIIAFKKAIEIDPNHANAYAGLGKVYLLQNRLEESISEYRKAIQLSPQDASLYQDSGDILQTLGNLEEAILNYKKAIQLDSNNFRVYNNLGFVLEQKGLIQEAIEAFQKAIEINPNYQKAKDNLYLIKQRLQK